MPHPRVDLVWAELNAYRAAKADLTFKARNRWLASIFALLDDEPSLSVLEAQAQEMLNNALLSMGRQPHKATRKLTHGGRISGPAIVFELLDVGIRDGSFLQSVSGLQSLDVRVAKSRWRRGQGKRLLKEAIAP